MVLSTVRLRHPTGILQGCSGVAGQDLAGATSFHPKVSQQWREKLTTQNVKFHRLPTGARLPNDQGNLISTSTSDLT